MARRLRSATRADLWFYSIAWARRRLRQIINDVQFGDLHVSSDSKRKVNATLTAANKRTDAGQPRRVP